MSDYAPARHTRREAGIQCHGRQAQTIHGAWIPAIHAGMTILKKVIMYSDKEELTIQVWPEKVSNIIGPDQ